MTKNGSETCALPIQHVLGGHFFLPFSTVLPADRVYNKLNSPPYKRLWHHTTPYLGSKLDACAVNSGSLGELLGSIGMLRARPSFARTPSSRLSRLLRITKTAAKTHIHTHAQEIYHTAGRHIFWPSRGVNRTSLNVVDLRRESSNSGIMQGASQDITSRIAGTARRQPRSPPDPLSPSALHRAAVHQDYACWLPSFQRAVRSPPQYSSVTRTEKLPPLP